MDSKTVLNISTYMNHIYRSVCVDVATFIRFGGESGSRLNRYLDGLGSILGSPEIFFSSSQTLHEPTFHLKEGPGLCFHPKFSIPGYFSEVLFRVRWCSGTGLD